jgi:hypothetical protein
MWDNPVPFHPLSQGGPNHHTLGKEMASSRAGQVRIGRIPGLRTNGIRGYPRMHTEVDWPFDLSHLHFRLDYVLLLL